MAITWSIPTPINIAIKNGAYIYHPVKMGSGGKFLTESDQQKERKAREVFRANRG